MNIVFDLGGVVFKWQPHELIQSLFDDEDKQGLIRDKILGHPDWVALDRGTLNREQAIKRGMKRTQLSHADINRFFSAVPQALTPVEDTLKLLGLLQKTDNHLYILSNMHVEFIAYLEAEYSFWEIFSGKVISCHCHKVKPEKEIYEHLLNKFSLVASDTVFIDDMEENTIAASKLGIKTIQFIDAEQCQQGLENLGCL